MSDEHEFGEINHRVARILLRFLNKKGYIDDIHAKNTLDTQGTAIEHALREVGYEGPKLELLGNFYPDHGNIYFIYDSKRIDYDTIIEEITKWVENNPIIYEDNVISYDERATNNPIVNEMNLISEVTRRAIIDTFDIGNIHWAGRLNDREFLARLYDLSKLPPSDRRYNDAAGDIFQHMVRNRDWDREWVFYDGRFNLLRATDDEFLRFLCETVHPVVRPDPEAVDQLVTSYNQALDTDGFQIVPGQTISGRPIFVAQSARRIVVFEEPTGWQKVDRQAQEMRSRLDEAGTEEQFQSVGLLCREVLITVAQEVYDPARHPDIDEKTPSDTDSKRMLEAIFELELKGSSNEEARAHAKAAVRLALALQHKRLADFRTAALCAEGTLSVVNMLAIIAGRRGR